MFFDGIRLRFLRILVHSHVVRILSRICTVARIILVTVPSVQKDKSFKRWANNKKQVGPLSLLLTSSNIDL